MITKYSGCGDDRVFSLNGLGSKAFCVCENDCEANILTNLAPVHEIYCLNLMYITRGLCVFFFSVMGIFTAFK